MNNLVGHRDVMKDNLHLSDVVFNRLNLDFIYYQRILPSFERVLNFKLLFIFAHKKVDLLPDESLNNIGLFFLERLVLFLDQNGINLILDFFKVNLLTKLSGKMYGLTRKDTHTNNLSNLYFLFIND